MRRKDRQGRSEWDEHNRQEEGWLKRNVLSGCVLHPSVLSHVRVLATLWTVAHQVLLSMGFSRQEYWSGLPFPSPGDLPNPGIGPRSPAFQADSLPSESNLEANT